MPSNKNVVGRFWGLYAETKSRANRIRRISKEIITLWNNLSFPSLSEQQILFKVDKLIKLFEKHRKRQEKQFEENLPRIFDITKPNGSWLCNEHQKIDNKQIESKSTVGYTTEKVAPSSAIHSSKRPRKLMQMSTSPTDLQE